MVRRQSGVVVGTQADSDLVLVVYESASVKQVQPLKAIQNARCDAWNHAVIGPKNKRKNQDLVEQKSSASTHSSNASLVPCILHVTHLQKSTREFQSAAT